MITENMRKSFHEAAKGAIEAAQLTLKNNPDMMPTQAYQLAFEFTMELWVSSFVMQLEFLARNTKDKND